MIQGTSVILAWKYLLYTNLQTYETNHTEHTQRLLRYSHNSLSTAGEANIISVMGSCFDGRRQLLHTLFQLDANWLEVNKNENGSRNE